ncbi:MAG: hypothetical protein DRR19_27700 [Candidatus Parabeggiatoa sp. nov. 1]|nr:MAG: hypothetical protein DRR19_27700 [Gammaproteobacteria bacterium]
MMKEQVNQLEKLLAVLSIGLGVAIKHNAIEIDEAEQLLYSPSTMNKLNEIGAKKEMIELIHAGTELDDLQSLIPCELAKTLDSMENNALKFLTLSPTIHPQLEKWLNEYLAGETEYVMLKQA